MHLRPQRRHLFIGRRIAVIFFRRPKVFHRLKIIRPHIFALQLTQRRKSSLENLGKPTYSILVKFVKRELFLPLLDRKRAEHRINIYSADASGDSDFLPSKEIPAEFFASPSNSAGSMPQCAMQMSPR